MMQMETDEHFSKIVLENVERVDEDEAEPNDGNVPMCSSCAGVASVRPTEDSYKIQLSRVVMVGDRKTYNTEKPYTTTTVKDCIDLTDILLDKVSDTDSTLYFLLAGFLGAFAFLTGITGTIAMTQNPCTNWIYGLFVMALVLQFEDGNTESLSPVLLAILSKPTEFLCSDLHSAIMNLMSEAGYPNSAYVSNAFSSFYFHPASVMSVMSI
jgi:hypothetical protein